MLLSRMTVELVPIVAVARNGVIGKEGKLPWHLSADLKRFKAITTGHPIVMGRKTWASLGRPLPGRTNIVVTRDAGFHADGAVVVHSVEEAVALAARSGAVAYVIGGADLYRQTFPSAERIHLTVLDRDVDGDTVLPQLDPAAWRIEHATLGREGTLDYAFIDLARKRADTAPTADCWAVILASAR